MGLFSNLLSSFQPKKPQQPAMSMMPKTPTATPQLFSSSAQNQSMMPPKVTAPVSQNYSLPKTNPVVPSAPKPTPGAAPVNPLTMTSAPSKPQMSMVQRTAALPKTIQGSGMTSAYASNPTNYKSPTPAATTPAPTTATTTPQNNMLEWFKKSSGVQAGIADTQTQNAQGATGEYIQMIKDSYGRARQDLIDQIPYLTQVSDAAKAELLAAAEDIRKSGDVEKASTTANYDEATLNSIRSKRETDAARQKMFAGLGTLDSTGNMGFTGQQTNADEEFNRVQQNRETEKARELTKIDNKVASAERTAKAEVQKEVLAFQENIRKINSLVVGNDADKEAQIRAAYLDLKTKVDEINGNLAVTQQNGELAKMQYLAEAEKASATNGANLSPEFVQTGIPKTAADFIYKTQNPAGFDTKIGASADAGKSTGKVLQAVNNVLNGDIGSMTGLVKTDWVPGTAGAQTKNDYDNLKSMLSLEGRSALKGSGAISDFEAQMLEKAANLGLGQNLSEDQFRAKLMQLKQELEAGGTGATGSTMNVRQKSTGQTGTIPVNEFDPNLYEKI